MDYYKKEKAKEWFHQHWKVILGTGIFVLIAATAMLVGFAMSGWDLIKWLHSEWAERFFITLALGAVAYLIFLYILYLFKKYKKREE